MNTHSMRLLGVVVLTGAFAGACGSSGGGATGAAGWKKSHGAAVAAVSTDLDLARQALDQGQRPVVLSTCNQLQEDLGPARKALPAPDPKVDGAVRTALDSIAAGVADCLDAARVANQAALTEKAMAELKDARSKMDDASTAVAAWT